MPFLLLLLLIVVYLPGKWPAPPERLGATGSVVATWAVVAVLSCWAFALSWHFRRRLGARPSEPTREIGRYSRWRKRHFLTLLGLYLGCLYGVGWADSMRGWGTDGSQVVPALELLILAPFIVALLLSWAFFYSVEREIQRMGARGDETSFPGRGAYLSMQARHNFLLILPPLLLMSVQQIMLWGFPGLQRQWIFTVVLLGMLGAVFLALPWMLILLLGLRPLPAGPLRDRLLAAGKRLGTRCHEILLWNTRKGMANALVTGLIPRLRYVVVSDRLVSDLTPAEVEAVFGHEAGHVKHHHLIYYLAFILLSMVVVETTWEAASSFWLPRDEAVPIPAAVISVGGTAVPAAEPVEEPDDVLGMMPLLALMGAYIFIVFGLLSRRCERQADIFGCRAVSCDRPFCSSHDDETVLAPRGQGLCWTGIGIFISALEKVVVANGISRSRPGILSSWQHSTIARRVEFLEQVRGNPALEHRFQRQVGFFKWGLLLGLGATLAVMLAVLAWNGTDLQHVWAMLLRF